MDFIPPGESRKYSASKKYYIFVAFACVFAFWGLYALEHYVGFNLRGKAIAPKDAIPIEVPLGITPASFLLAWIFYVRAKAFVERAVTVTAEVTALSVGSFSGHKNVWYSYCFQGRTYNRKQSILELTLEQENIVPGAKIVALVDPKNPRSSRLGFEFEWPAKTRKDGA